MGFDIGAEPASIFSMTPIPFSQVPSTPRSFPPNTPSTPSSSGSSFSQTVNDTPCPTNNASALLPKYSNTMEDVVFTSPRQANGDQSPTSQAPAKKGVLSYDSQPATAQPAVVLQPAAQPTPTPQPTPAQPRPAQTASMPQDPTGQATAAQAPAVPVTKDAAAAAPAWVINDPAQVFKVPLWPSAIAPRWATVKALPHLPPGGQVWDAAASVFVRAINDPALVFQIPSWSVTIAPRWASVESLPHLPPGTQLWDAAASVCFWATNDPALVFKTPSGPAVIAPRWAAVQALPQLPPGTQVWEFKGSLVPAVPQPSTSDNSKPVPTDLPVSSHPPTNHQPTVPSTPTPTENIPEFSFDDSMQALVGQLTTCHVSKPDTWAWSGPSVFGMFIKDKSKREDFHAHLVTMANTRLPVSGGNEGLNKIKHQQGAQGAAISQSSTNLQPTENNGSSSAIPEAMVQEQPLVVVAPQEKSAGPQSVEQADVPLPDIPETATDTGVPNENGGSDEAMETEESQPTDQGVAEQTHGQSSGKPQTAAVTGLSKNGDSDETMETESSQPTDNGKGVAVQGESDLTASTFQFDNVPQLLTEVNNPFVNAPTFPTSNAPASVRQLGGQQTPLFMGSTANGAASQEQTYEVGSDEDPNVDLEFDFSKHFRRAARAPADATPAAPAASIPPAASSAEAPNSAETSASSDASTSDASPSSEESSTPEASPPAETPPSSVASSPAGVSLPVEILPPTELSPLAEASPALTSPAGATAQASAPAPAVSVPFSAPPLPSGGLDLSASIPQLQSRGERKRLRETQDDSMHDREDRHEVKISIYGCRSNVMVSVQEQHERKKAIVAHLKAHPHIAYDEEYALTMMNDMFYDILPRLVSEVLFPLTEWTEAEQEDEAKALVDSMLEEELNERSFEMVQEAYEPSFGFKFPLCERNLFQVFSDWYLKFLRHELPFVIPNMTKKELRDLSDPHEDAVWKYIDDHPPKDRD